MSLVNRLVEQLEQRGLSIGPGKEPGQLLLHGPDKEKTTELMAAVKAFKPQLLKLYLPDGSRPREAETPTPEPQPDPEDESTRCKVCRAMLFTRDTSRLADPALCDRGGAKEVRNRAGEVVVPAEPRCPYKPRATWG